MALFIKKYHTKAAKLAGAALFVLLMFFNLQIATNPNSNGDIDLFGLKISFLESTVCAKNAPPKGPQDAIYCNGSYHYFCWHSSGLCGIEDPPC